MNYTKILWSLGTIAVVGALAVGVTGAFFTDTAESQDNTFNSGSLDLLLNLAENNDGWQNTHTNTPGYDNLNPGGDEANLSTQLRNDGTADAEGIGLAVDHTTDDDNLSHQMRITQLDWKGENLLEDGAGANLSDYEAPSSSDCDVTVTSGDSIQTNGIDAASSGDTVCVEADTYNENITIDKAITLASLEGKANTTIDASGGTNVIKIPAGTGEVTVKGFTLSGADRRGIFVGDFTDPASTEATITHNTITTIGHGNAIGSEVHGILVESGSDNTVIRDNLIEDLQDDGSTRAVGVSLVSQNTSDPLELVTVQNNIIQNIDAIGGSGDRKAKGVELSGNVVDAVIDQNTITDIGSSATNKPRGIAIIEDGSNTPADFQITANVIDNIIANFPGSETYEGAAGVFVGGYGSFGNNASLQYNEFRDGFVRNCCDASQPTLTATQNWWGQMTGPETEQVSSAVDTSDSLGGPHIGFVNGTDNNGNGFADLRDLEADPITNASPGLDAGEDGDLDFFVQLDGPTTGNSYQDSDLTSDFTFTLGQVTN